jgi:hypothetical protein
MTAALADLQRIVSAFAQDRPHLASRLEHAASVLLFRHILVLDATHFRVESEDTRRWYDVCDGRCSCEDYRRHGMGHVCKHLLAVALGQELGMIYGAPAADAGCVMPVTGESSLQGAVHGRGAGPGHKPSETMSEARGFRDRS